MRDGVKFTIAGAKLISNAAYAEKVDQLIIEKKLINKIECNGFVKDMPSYLQSLDVLVLASWSETCPMAVLEAMAAGVPVVATDVGGVNELLRPKIEEAAGFVVPVGHADQIAEKVKVLLGDESMCEKMDWHGREAAKKYFSLEACIDAHLKIYQKSNGGLR